MNFFQFLSLLYQIWEAFQKGLENLKPKRPEREAEANTDWREEIFNQNYGLTQKEEEKNKK